METLQDIGQFIVNKTRRNAKLYGDKLPHAAERGKYGFMEDGSWVGGFWTGLNWLCYEMTGEEEFEAAARRSEHRFVKRLYEDRETTDHDLGFLFCLSSVADYKLTGSNEARRIAVDAAGVLADRFNEKGKFIQAWNVWTPGDSFSEMNRGRMIIDCMYNLPLLFWASEETGDDRYKNIAIAHADTCAETIVRGDFTTFHTYLFNPDTGERIGGRTHQGHADHSCWSRGQSWAIGGYAYAYKYTKNSRYLELAKKLSQVFLAELEDDLVPMWDFEFKGQTSGGEPRDTSAAAIAAASFLEIASHLAEEEAKLYRDVAERIVKNLYRDYSTKEEPEHEGLLKEATGHKPKGTAVHSSLIYGDYYFAEAVARLIDKTIVYW